MKFIPFSKASNQKILLLNLHINYTSTSNTFLIMHNMRVPIFPSESN